MTQDDVVSGREIWIADKFSFKAGVEPTAAQTGWALTNHSNDRTINCDGAVGEIGDGLGTLILDLIAKGIISA